MTQHTFLSQLCKDNPEAIIVGSIGTISYDLALIEHKNKILVKGAMGSVLGVGFGYALGTKKKVIVVIGDGSFLMQMGAMSTIEKHKLDNLRIIVVNNNSYQSCGGQPTNFSAIKHLVPYEIFEPECTS